MGVIGHPPIGSGWEQWGKAGFRVDAGADFVVVAAHGEVDLDTAAGLDQAVRTALRTSPHLVVDLTHVTFIDSSAIAMMLNVHRHADALGLTVTWSNPRPQARRVLGITGADQVLLVQQPSEAPLPDATPA